MWGICDHIIPTSLPVSYSGRVQSTTADRQNLSDVIWNEMLNVMPQNSSCLTLLRPLIKGHSVLIALYTLIDLRTGVGHFVQVMKVLMIEMEKKIADGAKIKQFEWGWRSEAGRDSEMPFINQIVDNKPFKVSTGITFHCFCIIEVILLWPHAAVVHILGNAPLHCTSISAVPRCCGVSCIFNWTEF